MHCFYERGLFSPIASYADMGRAMVIARLPKRGRQYLFTAGCDVRGVYTMACRDVDACSNLGEHQYGLYIQPFFFAFSGWPWQLCRLVDPMASDVFRRTVAKRFSDAKQCCLDEYFSRRLKVLHGDAANDPDTYLDEGFLAFLKEVLCNAISATTNLELGFAAMRHWLCSSWRPPHIWSLAWYHVANRLQSIHAKWMEARFGKTPKFHGESRGRPVWAQTDRKQGQAAGCKRGRVVHSQNVFVKQKIQELQLSEPMVPGETKDARHRRLFVEASRAYKSVSDRSASQFDASVENAARNSFDDPLTAFVDAMELDEQVYPDSSSWGIADKDFPVGAAFWAQAHADAHRARANKSHGMESFVDESFQKWAQATG